MKQTFRIIVGIVLISGLLYSPIAFAGVSDVLLGNGCYVIPTQSTLVKVLVSAREKENVLVAQLTTGELWVLRAFFNIVPILTKDAKDTALCMPSS